MDGTPTLQHKDSAAALKALVTSVVIHVKGCDGIINKSTSHATIMTDAYVLVYDENNKKVLQTSVVENSVRPTWDTGTGAIGVDLTGHGNVTFQVWHRGRKHHKESDAFLGEVVVPSRQFVDRKRGEATMQLGARIKEPDPRVKTLDATPGALGTILVAWRQGDLNETQLGQVHKDGGGAANGRPLAELTIGGCRGLLKRDFGEYALSDPYIVVRYPEMLLRHRSEVVEMSLNPVFQPAPLVIHLPPEGVSPVLRLRAWNSNPKPEKDSFLGEADFDVRKLRSGDHEMALKPRRNEADALIAKLEGRLGSVYFKWRVLDPADEPPAEAPSAAPLPPQFAALKSTAAPAPEFDPKTYSSQRKVVPQPQQTPPQQQAHVVPVTLTNVVPVTIVNEEGRELVTSIPVDAPVRAIQDQITDYFTLCPSSQLLTYNRDAIDVRLSLEQNGALLLPGEPSVKLMLHTAKGPVVALTCVLPTGHEIPVSVPEAATIAELKRVLCATDGVRLRAEDIRLLWRYNELSDKATVDYYRLTNKARLDVVRRPQFGNGDPKKKPAPAASEPAAVAQRPQPQTQLQAQPQVQPHAQPQPQRRVTSAPAAAGPAASTAGKRPASAAAAPAVARPQSPRVVSKTMVSVPPRPRAYYETSGADGLEEQDADLVQLRKTLEAMRAQPSAPPPATDNTLRPGDKTLVADLRRQLEEKDRRHREALDRIEELEHTIERYQSLLRRFLRK